MLINNLQIHLFESLKLTWTATSKVFEIGNKGEEASDQVARTWAKQSRHKIVKKKTGAKNVSLVLCQSFFDKFPIIFLPILL